MDKVLQNHPNRVPVYVDKKANDDIPDIENHKYLVPKDMTVAQFMVVIRKKIKLDPTKAVFVFVGHSILPPNAATFSELYTNHAHSDGILYVNFAVENTFG